LAAKALGPEALARAIRHRRWRAIHARRSRPGVSDRREPGSAEQEREPKRVHRTSVPTTRRPTEASGAPSCRFLTNEPGLPPGVGRRRAGKPDARPPRQVSLPGSSALAANPVLGVDAHVPNNRLKYATVVTWSARSCCHLRCNRARDSCRRRGNDSFGSYPREWGVSWPLR
jgi:hypothetical protein